MTCSLSVLLLASALAAPLADDAAMELQYTGVFSKGTHTDEGEGLKRFTLYALLQPASNGTRQLAYVLDERGGGGWAWPERFGAVDLDAQWKPTPASPLKLLYDHAGTPTVIGVACPLFFSPKALKPGLDWVDGKESSEVAGTRKVLERDCWQVDVTTTFGHKRSVWVDRELPVLVSLEERVFIGQGEEHTLRMQLESSKVIEARQLARLQKPWQRLQKLQAELLRGDLEFRPELSEKQLALASKAIADLEKESAETPFAELVSAIGRDVKLQGQRTDELEKLAQRFVGKPTPELKLQGLNRKPFDSAPLKGKILVLHFWEYQGQPLVEPYGQVGYLDFLYGKRKKLGVEAIGIAVDGRLADAQRAGTALRSINKLRSFMNLSYPIAVDDGTLLGKFGDPRRAGAKLPLWVVIGPDGKVAHYRSGFYKINPDEGLQELDAVLIPLIRQRHAAEK